MSPFAVTALMFVSMLALMGTGLPIVYCLGSVGTLSAFFLWGEGALDVVYFAIAGINEQQGFDGGSVIYLHGFCTA